MISRRYAVINAPHFYWETTQVNCIFIRINVTFINNNRNLALLLHFLTLTSTRGRCISSVFVNNSRVSQTNATKLFIGYRYSICRLRFRRFFSEKSLFLKIQRNRDHVTRALWRHHWSHIKWNSLPAAYLMAVACDCRWFCYVVWHVVCSGTHVFHSPRKVKCDHPGVNEEM